MASTYDLKEMTPAVQRAIQDRQARYMQLQRLKQESSVGENNQGLIEILRAVGEAGPVVNSENQDRMIIYQAIVQQNQLGPAGLAEVKRVFAEVQRGKALPGETIQLPTGEWTRK